MVISAALAWAPNTWGQASGTAANGAAVTIRPIMATHQSPPYPTLSQRLGEQGTTTLKVEIGVDGVPTAVSVQKSSGSLRLDEAARLFVLANWKWEPPLQAGKPVAAATLVSLTWNLKESERAYVELFLGPGDYPPGAVERLEQGNGEVALELQADGSISRMTTGYSSGFPDLDAKAQEIVRRHHWQPAMMDGVAVPTMIAVVVHWQLPQTATPPSRSAPSK
jgi:TonB family protein